MRTPNKKPIIVIGVVLAGLALGGYLGYREFSRPANHGQHHEADKHLRYAQVL